MQQDHVAAFNRAAPQTCGVEGVGFLEIMIRLAGETERPTQNVSFAGIDNTCGTTAGRREKELLNTLSFLAVWGANIMADLISSPMQ